MRVLTTSFLLFFFCLQVCAQVKSQSMYYDVLDLRTYIDTSGRFIMPRSKSKNLDSIKIVSAYTSILRKYISNEEPLTIDQILTKYKNQNPFIAKLIVKQGGNERSELTKALSNTKINKSLSNISSAVSGFDVTNIADGVAQFLIERAHEEINVWFFQKFKDDISRSIELNTLFPVTSEFLLRIEPYQYAAMLNILREAFIKDLDDIIGNLENLGTLDKYQMLMKKKPSLNMAMMGLAGASIANKLSHGIHPADVIDSLGQKKYLEGVDDNLMAGIQMLTVVSQSIRDTTDNTAYVNAALFRTKVLNDPIAFRIYMGLIYQRLEKIKLILQVKQIHGVSSEDTIRIQDFLLEHEVEIMNNHNFGLKLIKKFNAVEIDFKKLKHRSDTAAVSYILCYEFYNSVIDLAETGIDATEYFPSAVMAEKKRIELKKFIYVARKGNDIYRNVNEKNYSLAILNFTTIYDTLFRKYNSQINNYNATISSGITTKPKSEQQRFLIQNRYPEYDTIKRIDGKVMIDKKLLSQNIALKKFYGTSCRSRALKVYRDSLFIGNIVNSKFLRYASFMAAVAASNSPDNVKAALEAAALPAGSASIKRQTPFNISVNAYLGLHYGNEYLEKIPTGKTGWATIYGLSAPIGVALSWGNFPFKGGSTSLFTSLIDIGAVASYRIKNDSTEQLPQIKLQNIFAPGIHIVLGIPKTPLSIGYGWQKGPQLRSVNIPDVANPGQYKNEMLNGYRWSIFLAVDLPLFNLYTKPKND